MVDLDQLIKIKTEELNKKVLEINEVRGLLEKLNTEALKLDGAISQLKELKDKEKK